MANKIVKFKQMKEVVINEEKVEVWPSNKQVAPYVNTETNIHSTVFKDPPNFNENLAKAILDLEKDEKFLIKLMRGGCGTKIDHIDRWKVPEADLVHARAISFFVNGLGFDQAVFLKVAGSCDSRVTKIEFSIHWRFWIVVSWVHQVNDPDPGANMTMWHAIVTLAIYIGPALVNHCLTRILMPDLKPGAMISFPGPMVHGVNPYNGDRPRITMSWNINRLAVPGKPPELG